MNFLTRLERDKDGIWTAECSGIYGRGSQGCSQKETIENIREAIELCLEVRSEQRIPSTVTTQQVEVFA